MNINTGREFSFTNPQDDRDSFSTPPQGFRYNYDGHLQGVPQTSRPETIDREENSYKICKEQT
jgi:hypothetical protein